MVGTRDGTTGRRALRLVQNYSSLVAGYSQVIRGRR